MTKAERESMNNYVLKNLDVFFDNHGDAYWKYDNIRLRYCSANVYVTPDYIVLKSYNTVVAFINKHTREFFDILRYVYGYTSTSAQHIAKFRNDYSSHFDWNKIYTYS